MLLESSLGKLVGSVRGGRVVESRLGKLVERIRATEPVPLRIRLWTGRSYELGPDPAVTLTVPTPSALRYFGSPDLMTLGEAYVEGHIDLEGRVAEAFRACERFTQAAGRGSAFAPSKRVTHTRGRDKKAIEFHYDVSNDFYRLFLDRNMVYSCAYYRAEGDSLDAAQEQKLDHILTKLQLRPGERLLDIGCGWGALIFRAAEKFGARAVGITLSNNQYEHVREQIRARGLGDRCEVRLQDYRDVPEHGGYDKISSVGMFEHVGLDHLVAYFRQIQCLLKDGGLALNHGITSVDPESRAVGMGAGDFIARYVFPHGELPHVGLALREMAAAGLEVVDVESLRRHYAQTCAEWAYRLEAHADRARAIAGEKRFRIWSLYLAGCAYGFAHNWMSIYQVLACKQGGPGMNPLPLTRAFMYPGG
jgi:cyclopropane-fatty-acyl-phospholipid synthase